MKLHPAHLRAVLFVLSLASICIGLAAIFWPLAAIAGGALVLWDIREPRP